MKIERKVEKIEPISKLPKEIPPKILEATELQKRENYNQEFPIDTVDISEEAQEILRKQEGGK